LVPVLFTFYIFIQQIYVLNILNTAYTLRFFSSKCSLFHNSNVFGSCIIHILYTGCAKVKKITPAPEGQGTSPTLCRTALSGVKGICDSEVHRQLGKGTDIGTDTGTDIGTDLSSDYTLL